MAIVGIVPGLTGGVLAYLSPDRTVVMLREVVR